MRDARLVERPHAAIALAWLSEGTSGLLVMRAKGAGLRCVATPDAQALLDAACARAESAGATRALLWQAVGDVTPGEPVAIAGACAPSRARTRRALDLLVEGLHGVATRHDF